MLLVAVEFALHVCDGGFELRDPRFVGELGCIDAEIRVAIGDGLQLLGFSDQQVEADNARVLGPVEGCVCEVDELLAQAAQCCLHRLCLGKLMFGASDFGVEVRARAYELEQALPRQLLGAVKVAHITHDPLRLADLRLAFQLQEQRCERAYAFEALAVGGAERVHEQRAEDVLHGCVVRRLVCAQEEVELPRHQRTEQRALEVVELVRTHLGEVDLAAVALLDHALNCGAAKVCKLCCFRCGCGSHGCCGADARARASRYAR